MADIAALLPPADETNRPYREALKDGRLCLPRCDACGEFRLRASRYCPSCGGTSSRWEELSGSGRLWGRCVFHQVYFEAFRDRVPYGVVIVELEEGVRVFSNLADGIDTMQVPIGTALAAVYEPVSDEVTLLRFRPA